MQQVAKWGKEVRAVNQDKLILHMKWLSQLTTYMVMLH